jgi:hypothetical protein
MPLFRHIALGTLVLFVFTAGCVNSRNVVMRDPVAHSGASNEEIWYRDGGARVAYTAVPRHRQLYAGYGVARDPALYAPAPTKPPPRKRPAPKPQAPPPKSPDCPPCPPGDAGAGAPPSAAPAQGAASGAPDPSASQGAESAAPEQETAGPATPSPVMTLPQNTGGIAAPPSPPRMPLPSMPSATPAPPAPNASDRPAP